MKFGVTPMPITIVIITSIVLIMFSKRRYLKFINVLLSIKSKEGMEDFLKGILTAKELLEIPNRLKIIKMLKKGISQHVIAGDLKVGVATVTRGSKELQEGLGYLSNGAKIG